MNNCFTKIYRPFIIAQYSLFSKSNKNKKNEFPLEEVYEMMSYLNVTAPVWSELTIILLLSWKNRSRLGQCAGGGWDTFDNAKLMIFS